MKKITIKIFITSVLLFILAAPSYSKGVYILCYHAFLERKDPYSFTSDQFKDQLNKLKSSGFNFVSFEDVIADRLNGNKNILISIDDGNHSVYQAYYSIMKPMGIKPLLGIYPAVINRMKYAMTWEQVKKLSDDGCYIASHGYHHMFLSEKYFKEDPASFKKEIYLSKKILEEKLNRKIDTMLYPFGVNSETAISEMKNAGYRYGFTIEPKIEPLPVSNSFQIHRYLMTKPGQKGVIAFITKNALKDHPQNNQSAVNNTQSNTQTGVQNDTSKYSQQLTDNKTNPEDRISIINYPEKIKKLLSSELMIIPVNNEPVKKTDVKFKPFVHPNKIPAESKSKSRKIAAKNEKKNHRKKKTV